MKTSSAKAKGRRAAAQLRECLLETFPYLEEDDIFVTSAGETGEDLKLSPVARDVIPYSIEVKNCERLNVWQALKQADTRDYTPLLVFTRNREDMYATVKLEDFLSLLKEVSE